jgi:hypothetical protein
MNLSKRARALGTPRRCSSRRSAVGRPLWIMVMRVFSSPRLEYELGLESQRRAVQPRLRRGGEETSRAVDDLEHVAMPIKLAG